MVFEINVQSSVTSEFKYYVKTFMKKLLRYIPTHFLSKTLKIKVDTLYLKRYI
jgi:hypothetical protein